MYMRHMTPDCQQTKAFACSFRTEKELPLSENSSNIEALMQTALFIVYPKQMLTNQKRITQQSSYPAYRVLL